MYHSFFRSRWVLTALGVKMRECEQAPAQHWWRLSWALNECDRHRGRAPNGRLQWRCRVCQALGCYEEQELSHFASLCPGNLYFNMACLHANTQYKEHHDRNSQADPPAKAEHECNEQLTWAHSGWHVPWASWFHRSPPAVSCYQKRNRAITNTDSCHWGDFTQLSERLRPNRFSKKVCKGSPCAYLWSWTWIVWVS